MDFGFEIRNKSKYYVFRIKWAIIATRFLRSLSTLQQYNVLRPALFYHRGRPDAGLDLADMRFA